MCACTYWKKKSESDVTYDEVMVTHTRNLCSAFNPSKVHTHSSEHTPGAVGSHLCYGAQGAVGGSVPCSRAPQSWYWRWRECSAFTPPTYNSCWPETRTPFDYESDSLTIRPGLPMTCKPYYDFHLVWLTDAFAKAMVYNTTLEIYVVLIFLVHYETVVQTD